MNEPTLTAESNDTGRIADLDNLTWDDWTPAEICALENGADCAACEG